MSEFIRRGECLEAAAKVNSALTMFEERISQLRKDVEKLGAENKALKEKVQLLEVDLAALKGQMVGYLQAVKGAQA